MGLAHKTTVWKGPWCATQRFLTLLRSKGQVSITTAVLHIRLGENNVLLCHGLLWTSRAPGGFSTKNHSVFSQRKANWVWAQTLEPGSEPTLPSAAARVPRSRPLFPALLPQPIPKPEWEAASQPGLDSSPVTQFICTELSVKSHRPAAIWNTLRTAATINYSPRQPWLSGRELERALASFNKLCCPSHLTC